LLFASHLLELAGDPYASHNLLRKAFRTEHPAPLPEHRPALSHAYPLAFHSEIAVATRDFPWDPMLFQGLVREESAFMSAVVSWAGAMGLSQLMWPTAKETARKMGIKGLKRGDLDQPALNLAIGSTYFQGLHKRWKGHLPLAIASYNAGPGAVNRWLKSHGELELDLWVESIPFDQTRHYVKRVLSSFQVYHFMYDDGAPYVPLRIGPVRAAIDRPDPVL
jgi:soluble lytic murein transglycosylase